MGFLFYNVHNLPDSAIVCYTIIGRRYNKSMSVEEKDLCAKSWLQIWKIYFFENCNLNKMYESLIKARDIYSDMGYENPELDMDFGAFYQTLALQGKDNASLSKAMKYYQRAFDIATREKHERTYDIVFTNLLTVAVKSGNLNSIKPFWKKYQKMKVNNKIPLHEYNILMYNGLNAINAKDFKKAKECFAKQIKILPANEEMARFRYIALTNYADAQELSGDIRGAIATMKKSDNIGKEYGFKDMQMEVYNILADYYHELGDKAMEDRYTRKYYVLKDSLINARNIAEVKDFEFNNEMNKVNAQLDEMAEESYRNHLLLIFALIIVVTVIGFSYKLWRKNKTLSERNRFLYEQSLQQIEDQIEAKPEKNTAKNSEENERIDSITEKIEEALAHTDEICSQQFSAERLSQLTGVPYHVLSRVINENYKCNFNVLINTYRIKEACRRIASDTKHQLTIESLSGDVGFKSRTTFTSAFKRNTGLTPSEYLKLAWRKNEGKG